MISLGIGGRGMTGHWQLCGPGRIPVGPVGTGFNWWGRSFGLWAGRGLGRLPKRRPWPGHCIMGWRLTNWRICHA